MEELVSKLGIDWKLLLANTLTFFLVLWILRKFAFRPIMEVLEKRQRTVSDGLNAAQRSQDELAAIQQEKERVMREAKSQALAIVQEAKQQGELAKQKLAELAQSEAAATVAHTKAMLDRERLDMVTAAKKELADVVVVATEKILEQTMDAKARTKLTTQAVAALKEARR